MFIFDILKVDRYDLSVLNVLFLEVLDTNGKWRCLFAVSDSNDHLDDVFPFSDELMLQVFLFRYQRLFSVTLKKNSPQDCKDD